MRTADEFRMISKQKAMENVRRKKKSAWLHMAFVVLYTLIMGLMLVSAPELIPSPLLGLMVFCYVFWTSVSLATVTREFRYRHVVFQETSGYFEAVQFCRDHKMTFTSESWPYPTFTFRRSTDAVAFKLVYG